MAERVLQSTAVIPAGTPFAAPATVKLPFDGWDIELIDLEVPPGPTGALGFQLANNGRPWIPRSVGEWLTWDDHVESFVPTGYPSAGGWQVIGWNVGAYDHAVVVRFHVNPISVGPAAGDNPVVLTFVEHAVKRSGVVVL